MLRDLNKWIEETKPLPMFYVDGGKQVELPKELNRTVCKNFYHYR